MSDYQVSLKNNFVDQSVFPRVEYDVVSDTKRCSKCGELKIKSEFPKDIKMRSGLCSWCKVCMKKFQSDWYKDNRDEIIERAKLWSKDHDEHIRVRQFLYHKSKNGILGYLHGSGVCLICGEMNPLVFENHHVVPWDDEFVISLCANCHRRYRINIKDQHMLFILNAIENSKFLWGV